MLPPNFSIRKKNINGLPGYVAGLSVDTLDVSLLYYFT